MEIRIKRFRNQDQNTITCKHICMSFHRIGFFGLLILNRKSKIKNSSSKAQQVGWIDTLWTMRVFKCHTHTMRMFSLVCNFLLNQKTYSVDKLYSLSVVHSFIYAIALSDFIWIAGICRHKIKSTIDWITY